MIKNVILFYFISSMGPSINDVTVLGGGQRFVTCLTISGRLLRKKRDIGGGGVKKSIFAVTSFMDDPHST
jgi:hypothetical protein